MAEKYNVGVPGVPLGALDAIADANTRQVLRAIVDGWAVRNGDTGKGDSRFVTAGELATLQGKVGGLAGAGTGGLGTGGGSTTPGANPLTSAQIANIINQLQASVLNSPLWASLGERITAVDLGIVREQQARVAAVQTVADGLAAQAATQLGFVGITGSKISRLESSDANQATVLSGLTTRTGSNESTIINLQTTTAFQATSLTNLETKANGWGSQITNFLTTTATQAQSLSSLTTRAAGAESNISTLKATTATQASVLDSMYTRVANNESAIATERVTRANADNAVSTIVQTQYAQVAGNLGAIQSLSTTAANSVAAVASQVTTLQATVSGHTSLIQQEAETRASKDGEMLAKYTVKIDQDGFVSGFGLMSTANTSKPFSEFLIRADRFAVGSPSAPNATFTVTAIRREWSPGYNRWIAYVDTNTTLTNKLKAGDYVFISNESTGLWNKWLKVEGIVPGFTYAFWAFCDGTEPTPAVLSTGASAFHGVKAAVPFIVTTTSTTMADGTVIPPGTYIDYAMVKHLEGAYIHAGLLEAAQIYTGSQYIDLTSKYPLYATACGSWMGEIVGAAAKQQIYVFSGLTLYGPGRHYSAPVNQRVRYADANKPLTIVFSVAAVVDHYLTLWYRETINGNVGQWYPYNPLPDRVQNINRYATIVEPQSSNTGYGTVTALIVDQYGIGTNHIVEFGFSVTDTNLNAYNASKLDMYNVTASLLAFNL